MAVFVGSLYYHRPDVALLGSSCFAVSTELRRFNIGGFVLGSKCQMIDNLAKTNDHESTLRAAMKASCGILTVPTVRIRFFPAFCFSNSLRFRVASPP